MTTFIFTNGHISIRRGRVTRQYIPTLSSLRRLSHLSQYGPTEYKETNRSTIYTWHGYHTMNSAQKAVYSVLVGYQQNYNQSWNVLVNQANTMNMHFHNLPMYQENVRDLTALLAVKDCAIAAGIHKVMIELISPCPHGNANSRCYTCMTTM